LYLLWGQALFAPSTKDTIAASDDAATNAQTQIAAEVEPTVEAAAPPEFTPGATSAEPTQVTADTAASLAPAQTSTSQETSSSQSDARPIAGAAEPLLDSQPAPAVQTSQPAAGADSLVFTFTEDCWVQVQDGSGTTIHAATSKTGDTLALEGVPPFSVLLGNARAATLAHNGELVAITPVPGRNTLRFAVGN
jgi:cytoskeleton protein RodZ